MSAFSIRHISPEFRAYAGRESLDGLSAEVNRAGASRIVLVCGASMKRHERELAVVEDALGDRLVYRFDEAREHSPLPIVERAAHQLVEHEADGVVAVGGGSAVVTARAAVILAAENISARNLCTFHDGAKLVSPRLTAPKIPQWVVASTPTTAFAKAGAAVRDPDTGERLALFDPKARAAGVFFHPDIAATAPASIVRGAGLNAASMCIEGLQSGVDDPLAIANLRYGLEQLRHWLLRLEKGDSGEVGVRLMLASLLAGQGSDHVGTGLSQPIAHILGPQSTVGNGLVEALLLPHVMKFNVGWADAGIDAVAAALRPEKAPSAEVAVEAVEDLLAAADAPKRLRDVGIDQEALGPAVEHIVEDWAATQVPRVAGRHELRELLEAAW